MKSFVIVTLRLSNKEDYDIEVPTDVPVKKLLHDIAEQLNGYLKGKHLLRETDMRLHCERLNRMLLPGETFAEAGIWNGDILILL